jgi:hypothetical protein
MEGIYKILSNEPWCWPRHWINEQTDRYLWKVVIQPAVKRSRKLDQKHDRRTFVGHGWENSKSSLPNREQYILIGERLGVPRKVSEKEYDKFLESKKGK